MLTWIMRALSWLAARRWEQQHDYLPISVDRVRELLREGD